MATATATATGMPEKVIKPLLGMIDVQAVAPSDKLFGRVGPGIDPWLCVRRAMACVPGGDCQ